MIRNDLDSVLALPFIGQFMDELDGAPAVPIGCYTPMGTCAGDAASAMAATLPSPPLSDISPPLHGIVPHYGHRLIGDGLGAALDVGGAQGLAGGFQHLADFGGELGGGMGSSMGAASLHFANVNESMRRSYNNPDSLAALGGAYGYGQHPLRNVSMGDMSEESAPMDAAGGGGT